MPISNSPQTTTELPPPFTWEIGLSPPVANPSQSFCCALSDTSTEVLAIGCKNLTHLNLSFCGSAVSDSSLSIIGRHLELLKELSVRGCVRVTGTGVENVVDGVCVGLKRFDVSQCRNLGKWIEGGGVGRWERVKFKVVAGGGW